MEVCYSFVYIVFCTVSNAAVPAPYYSPSGKRTIRYIILVLSPSYFVDKGIILDKNEETLRIYRVFGEEYRKF